MPILRVFDMIEGPRKIRGGSASADETSYTALGFDPSAEGSGNMQLAPGARVLMRAEEWIARNVELGARDCECTIEYAIDCYGSRYPSCIEACELPSGPVERIVEYHASFTLTDREVDYRVAWAHFEGKV
jgi:hypothetical protein